MIKAFFFNNQGYKDHEEYLSQTVAYQAQILKVIDNNSLFGEVEEEIIITDSNAELAIPIGYIVFQKQPSLSLF